MAALYITSEAHIVAEGLNATDLDGWTYAVDDNDNGTSYITVTDDAGEFVDYLGIRFLVDRPESTYGVTKLRTYGGGVAFKRH
tara:strand:+ start:269 stop:517 length:249 start_codon:yes stop_codon:yes gene_type:complete